MFEGPSLRVCFSAKKYRGSLHGNTDGGRLFGLQEVSGNPVHLEKASARVDVTRNPWRGRQAESSALSSEGWRWSWEAVAFRFAAVFLPFVPRPVRGRLEARVRVGWTWLGS